MEFIACVTWPVGHINNIHHGKALKTIVYLPQIQMSII